ERKKFTIKDEKNISTQNHHLNENIPKKKILTKEEPRCTSSIVHPGDNYEEAFLTNKFTSLAEDLSKEERSKDTDEETGYCTAVETLSNISELEISSETKGKTKKFTKKRVRNIKRKKRTNETEEEFFSAESDIDKTDLKESQNYFLKKSGRFYKEQREIITYKLKSTRLKYFDSDLQYLKAIVFTKYIELFTKHENDFYIISKDRREKICEEDFIMIDKYKQDVSRKYENLLKNDCNSYIFFYDSDGVFLNCEFMLLNDFLREYTSKNDCIETLI
ncbi:hypothetical protein H311_00640, partial [Anncaliia algerae PRA109]